MSTNEKKGPQPAKAGAREENIGGRHYNMAGQPSPVLGRDYVGDFESPESRARCIATDEHRG